MIQIYKWYISSCLNEGSGNGEMEWKKRAGQAKVAADQVETDALISRVRNACSCTCVHVFVFDGFN